MGSSSSLRVSWGAGISVGIMIIIVSYSLMPIYIEKTALFKFCLLIIYNLHKNIFKLLLSKA